MAVCYSSDGGSNWERVELTSTRGYVYALAIHPNNPDIVLAGGYCHNGSSYVGKIFRTADGGVHWTDVSQGIDENYNYVYNLIFDSNSPNIVYAGSIKGIYKSVDGGTSWNNLNTEVRNVYGLAINPYASVIYAAGYGYGIYSSSNGGNNWSAMNDGLTTFEIDCLVLDSQNQLLFAGTRSAGVFRYDISTNVEPAISKINLPTKLKLLPNYPNPFNPTTTIIYDIPGNNNSYVSLIIYNISGQAVKTLVDERQQAGRYSIDWDGTGDFGLPLTSGVYICVLTANNYQCIRKMTLVR